MTSARKATLVLPALRGVMGDWVYYSCLMDVGNLAKRVRYAEEVHKNDSLSKMIQRRLNSDRSTQIAEYLRSQPERFFNSLVVAA
jgi:DNA sulfur modification protein DndB